MGLWSRQTRWWQSAARDGEKVPDWIQANLHFYDQAARRSRIGFYTIETLAIVVAAAIPASTSVGGSAALAGVLGAVVTALIGLRQLTAWRESWVRSARTRSALEREVVLWSNSVARYAGPGATVELLLIADTLVAVETDRWAALRQREHEDRQGTVGRDAAEN